MSAETTTATANGRRAGGLRIAVLLPGMKDRQRCAHEFCDLTVCRDATWIERARELRVAEREELLHVANVLELQR